MFAAVLFQVNVIEIVNYSHSFGGNFGPQSHCFFFILLIVKSEDLENLEEKEYFGIVTVRILVHEWPMTSGSSSQLIVIQEEVVEIDGRQVRQYAC